MRKVLYTLPLRIESRDDDLLIPLPKGGSKRVICKGASLQTFQGPDEQNGYQVYDTENSTDQESESITVSYIKDVAG